MTTDYLSDWHPINGVVGPCMRPGGHVLTARALEVCNLPSDALIIDVGCGAGGTLAYLEQIGHYRRVGFDCSGTLLEESASRLTKTCLVQGSAEKLPFREGSFDGLFLECVLSIFPDRMAALFESARVLREGGCLIMSDVFSHGGNNRQPLESNPYQLKSEGFYTKNDILCALTGLGFLLLVWEEHERILKEFIGQIILAGQCLPDIWGCEVPLGNNKKTDRPKISYFLLVAQKEKRY